MTGNEYQQLAERTNLMDKGSEALYYAALGLAGEAGEVANTTKKIMRDHDHIVTDEKRAEIKKELGDVMWYIARLSSELGLSLDEIMQANIDKLASRMERGKLTGDGNDR